MITYYKGSKIVRKIAKMKNIIKVKSMEECDDDDKCSLADGKYGD